MASSVGFIRFVFSTDATQAKGLLAFAPVGLPPTEHVCLFWTHSLAKTQTVLNYGEEQDGILARDNSTSTTFTPLICGRSSESLRQRRPARRLHRTGQS